MHRPILLLALAALAVVPATTATHSPGCSGLDEDRIDCEAAVDGIVIALDDDCGGWDPECPIGGWRIEAASCAALPGPLVVVWELVLADVPAWGQASTSIATGDPECPHHSRVLDYDIGGALSLPNECIRVSATSPAGAATKLRCVQS